MIDWWKVSTVCAALVLPGDTAVCTRVVEYVFENVRKNRPAIAKTRANMAKRIAGRIRFLIFIGRTPFTGLMVNYTRYV